MKRITLTFLALGLFATASFAQPAQGTIQLGTSTALFGGFSTIAGITPNNSAGITFSRSKTKFDGETIDGPKETAFNLAPRIGFAAADGLILGLNLDFLFVNSKDEDDDENKITAIAAGPFARYFISTSGNAVPFVEGSATFGRATSQFNDGDKDKTNLVSLNAGVGVAFFFNENISFDIMAGYSHNSSKDPDSDFDIKSTASGFGLGVGLSIFLADGADD